MFLAFTAFGSMPLLGYISAALLTSFAGSAVAPQRYFALSVVITAVRHGLSCPRAPRGLSVDRAPSPACRPRR